MSEYELHSLVADLFRDMDHMIEFWLSATFAVVVARFVGRGVLNRSLLRTVALLYLIAALLSFSRYGLVAGRLNDYSARLVEEGMTPISQIPAFAWAMVVFVPALRFLGTAAALRFLLASGHDLTDPSDGVSGNPDG